MKRQLEALQKAVAEEAEAVDRLRSVSEANRRGLKENAEAELPMEESLNFALAERGKVRQLYRKLDKTMEWVENNYYKLPIESQLAGLVPVNAFWRDYAAYLADNNGSDRGFLSENFPEASGNFPEMMLALSVLDLPFKAKEHKSSVEDGAMTVEPGSPMIIFHKEVRTASAAAGKSSILVSQNFFRQGDRYRMVDNERRDKFVTDEFLVNVVYGCQVVITNPTSTPQKLDVLLQIPRGAMPVLGSKYTNSVHIALNPFQTQTLEYYFYFPAAGELPHYPVHVARQQDLVAFVEPMTFNVVEKLSKVDTESWDYLSQHGSEEQVIEYLKTQNLGRVNLSRIAWRMQEEDTFDRVLEILRNRFAYDGTLWSYGIKHNDAETVREYLRHMEPFLQQCGRYIDSPLATIDPVERHWYQHMEYAPLVNARAHQLGKTRKIVNDRFHQQYERTMQLLCYRPTLTDEDKLAVTYYMLLQDRVEEALAFFGEVDRSKVATDLQYDYVASYVAFYTGKLGDAKRLAAKHKDHPVDRWRKKFAAVQAQLDEIAGEDVKVVDAENRSEQQTRLAATEPSFDFTIDDGKVTINYQNLKQVEVNYYLMDIELLFSRKPFVQEYSNQFSFVDPNQTATISLPGNAASRTFDLPKELRSRNVMVEITGEGITQAEPFFSNMLTVQLMESYGQVRVSHRQTNKPHPKVYVKVYARMNNGQVRFYKDGYTDLRGRFDYTSLNTNELDNVREFSILILSDEHGAVVREAKPPQR